MIILKILKEEEHNNTIFEYEKILDNRNVIVPIVESEEIWKDIKSLKCDSFVSIGDSWISISDDNLSLLFDNYTNKVYYNDEYFELYDYKIKYSKGKIAVKYKYYNEALDDNELIKIIDSLVQKYGFYIFDSMISVKNDIIITKQKNKG